MDKEELLSRIKILEAENDDLSDRAEESLLTSLVAESINVCNIPELVIEKVLERISILKNLPICICYFIDKNTAKPLQHFTSINAPWVNIPMLKLSENLLEELKEKPIILSHHQDYQSDIFKQLEIKNDPIHSVGIFPFSCRELMNGLFVFIDMERELRLPSMAMLLQNVINMTCSRMDNISLVNELETLNNELNSRVNIRTRELAEANANLREEINERKRIEKELIDAKERAEKSNELKSQFLAQMSHEIRTPINTILNFTSLIKMDLSDQVSDDLTTSFDSIENAASRLLRTINLILNMSEIELGIYEPELVKTYVIKDILNPLVTEYKYAAKKKNLTLELNCKADFEIVVDLYTINQIFTNLLDNSIKYTNKGGVTINVSRNSKTWHVEFSDTGIGIEKEYIPQLFEKFTQEVQGYSRSYEGNGLGLSLVKEYCNINKASIHVESEKEQGSTFRVEFNFN